MWVKKIVDSILQPHLPGPNELNLELTKDVLYLTFTVEWAVFSEFSGENDHKTSNGLSLKHHLCNPLMVKNVGNISLILQFLPVIVSWQEKVFYSGVKFNYFNFKSEIYHQHTHHPSHVRFNEDFTMWVIQDGAGWIMIDGGVFWNGWLYLNAWIHQVDKASIEEQYLINMELIAMWIWPLAIKNPNMLIIQVMYGLIKILHCEWFKMEQD